jgi:hypothetical protein
LPADFFNSPTVPHYHYPRRQPQTDQKLLDGGEFQSVILRLKAARPLEGGQMGNPEQEEEHPMIPEKLQEIMKKDGVVAIATLGPDGPHMVNTWNSYLRISQDGRLFIPAGYMHKTETNIAYNPNLLITLGSSKVEGLHGAGAGFLIKGKARFVTSGPDLIS